MQLEASYLSTPKSGQTRNELATKSNLPIYGDTSLVSIIHGWCNDLRQLPVCGNI